MPLSDHERQVLAAMEAALEKEDPKLVSVLSGLPKGGKGLSIGALLLVAGMGVIIAGLVAKNVLIGVVGFLIALIGTIILISALPKAAQAKVQNKKAPRKSWSDKAQERWDER
jgi:hypothetical protein